MPVRAVALKDAARAGLSRLVYPSVHLGQGGGPDTLSPARSDSLSNPCSGMTLARFTFEPTMRTRKFFSAYSSVLYVSGVQVPLILNITRSRSSPSCSRSISTAVGSPSAMSSAPSTKATVQPASKQMFAWRASTSAPERPRFDPTSRSHFAVVVTSPSLRRAVPKGRRREFPRCRNNPSAPAARSR